MSVKIKNSIPEGISKLKLILKQNLVNTVESALIPIRNEIIQRTPVVTGNLKQSISSRAHPENVDSIKVQDWKVVGKIGTAVRYAAKVEFRSKQNRHFFSRGFYAGKNLALKVLQNKLRNLLK